jgi:hypothetical protein
MLVTFACSVLSCVGDPPESSSGGGSSSSGMPEAGAKKRVFLTAEHNGDLNGKPDAFCKLQAKETNKTWRALIASSTAPASKSLIGLTGPYYLYGSEVPLVTLTNGEIPMATIQTVKPDRDVDGSAVSSVNIWVGNVFGNAGPVESRCGEWRVGGPSARGHTWNVTSGVIDTNLICETPFARVLCFEE